MARKNLTPGELRSAKAALKTEARNHLADARASQRTMNELFKKFAAKAKPHHQASKAATKAAEKATARLEALEAA